MNTSTASFFESVQHLIDSNDPLQCCVRASRSGECQFYRDLLLTRAGNNVVLGEGLWLYTVEDPARKFSRHSGFDLKNPRTEDATRYTELLTRVVAMIDLRDWKTLITEKLITSESVLSEVHDGRRKCITCFVNCDEGFTLWYDVSAKQHRMEICYFAMTVPVTISLSSEKAVAVYFAVKRALHQQVCAAQTIERSFAAFLAAENQKILQDQIQNE